MSSRLKFRQRLSAMSCFIAITSASVLASDDWTLTTSDLHSRLVQLRNIDHSGVSVTADTTADTTQPSSIPLSDFLSLDRANTSVSITSHWIAQLRNGDTLAGEAESLDGETLHWRETLIGPMSLPMSDVVALRHADSEGITPTVKKKAANLDDVVKLANGDELHGVVTDLNSKSVSVQRSDGTASPVPIDSIANINFAATAPPPKSIAADRAFRFTLTDGSQLTASDPQLQPPALSIQFRGTRCQLAIETVQSIQQLNGPVSWLSDTPPAEDVQIPLLGAPFPTRFNRDEAGLPLRFGDRIFSHGIAVHAYSRLSWPIDSRDEAFRTQFAIDGDAPYADVTVRIKLDGQVVSETKDVRAGQLRDVTMVDVRGKHTLTLEVEDPSNDDIQARLNWLEPALLRQMPGQIHESIDEPSTVP